MRQLRLGIGQTSSAGLPIAVVDYLRGLEQFCESEYAPSICRFKWRNLAEETKAQSLSVVDVVEMVLSGNYAERYSSKAYLVVSELLFSVTDVADLRVILLRFLMEGADWYEFEENTGISVRDLYHAVGCYLPE